MPHADRPLDNAVFRALMYWPGIVGPESRNVADLSVLPPLFNELLDEWPWWDRAWRVTDVEPARPRQVARNNPAELAEVTVPGTMTRDGGDTLPCWARVRFSEDRLAMFQVKVGDAVLGPSSVTDGFEPHPFGPVFSALMDLRGISPKEMARRAGKSMSTIKMMRAGAWNPHRVLVADLATALGVPEQDLLAVAGLDVEPVAHPDRPEPV